MQARAQDRPLMGYCDRITYEQGEAVEVRAAGRGVVEIDLVRLNHPPDDPQWPLPGYLELDDVDGVQVSAEPQELFAGSYLVVEDAARLGAATALTMTLYLLPTRVIAGHVQGIWSSMDSAGAAGLSVVLDEAGHVAVLWGRGGGDVGRAVSGVPLVEGRWTILTVSADEEAGIVGLSHRLLAGAPRNIGQWAEELPVPGLNLRSDAPLLIGAARLPSHAVAGRLPGAPCFDTCFNGKIDSPVILGGVVTGEELLAVTPLRATARPDGVLAAWDLSSEPATAVARDAGPHGYDGQLVNSPTRAVTGARWRGLEQQWVHSPEQYAAVHFHDDDLDDARWPVTATVHLPPDLPSAVYAVRLREADTGREDLVPIVVVPSRDNEGADGAVRTLIVMPTYTYVSYANLLGNGEKADYVAAGLALPAEMPPHEGQELLDSVPEIGGSLYDVHSDGSGRTLSSPRRPVLNMRPDWKSSRRDAYRHLAADLYVLGWLDKLGVPYDVTSDHVVNKRGQDLLDQYDVVLTGTHPEYISGQILDAFEGYLAGGGSVMYLGGNGFYWVTTESETIPEQIEVRRGFAGTRTWTSAPGELFHAMTGEFGGIWRHRGRTPNAMLGVGFIAQGADGGAAPYRRTRAGEDGVGAFLFEGVTAEVIGARGFDMGGAASDEVDRFSVKHGSPPWGEVVASSTQLSSFYKLAIEEIQITRERTGGDYESDVRADLVYLEQEAGGFVFSVGSIGWVQSMAIDYFDNDVARVTENALRAALVRRAG